MKANELESYDETVQRMGPLIDKEIAEIKANLTNHGVQFDKVIECRRMFYESEQGARTFNVMIETIQVNKFKSPLVVNYNFTELIKCSEEQKKRYQMQAESRNGSACYVNLPPQYIEEIQKLDGRFSVFYILKHKFSKYLFLIRFGWEVIRVVKAG
uniref:DHC_N1 domain-containing protein n=1 Tax=Schistosoma mansoni TaxID=6183 RepID=A0A5K4FBG6_SCHMA